jgi:cytochrome oxidase assembly protein ShyY1
MAGLAYAGHAGELGASAMMPHELVGLVAVLILLVIALAVLAGLAIWRLLRVERRLRLLEQELAADRKEMTSTRP